MVLLTSDRQGMFAVRPGNVSTDKEEEKAKLLPTAAYLSPNVHNILRTNRSDTHKGLDSRHYSTSKGKGCRAPSRHLTGRHECQ